MLKAAGLAFDAVHTSVLKRAIKTAWLALEELDQMYIPIVNDWRLNERHYGALTGESRGVEHASLISLPMDLRFGVAAALTQA